MAERMGDLERNEIEKAWRRIDEINAVDPNRNRTMSALDRIARIVTNPEKNASMNHMYNMRDQEREELERQIAQSLQLKRMR